jgi:hypothetical protein
VPRLEIDCGDAVRDQLAREFLVAMLRADIGYPTPEQVVRRAFEMASEFIAYAKERTE